MENRPKIHRTYLCSFCGKNQAQVLRLVAGPRGVYVCDECIQRYTADNGPHTQQESQMIPGTSGANRCSFCGNPQKKVQRLVLGPGGVNICNECLALCQKIFAEESRSRHGP